MSCASRIVGKSGTPGYSCTPGSVGFLPNIATCSNATNVSIGKPLYMSTAPGRACAVSTNFTRTTTGVDVLAVSPENPVSVFQSCCGVGNTKSENYVRSGFGVTGGPCGYTFCNVTDQVAQKSFLSCLGEKAPGIKGDCFTSYISGSNFITFDSNTPPSASTTAKPTSGSTKLVGIGMITWVLMAVVGIALQ
ncbi:hypothetical protein GLAREA_10482 [Glarea lozoyensis ATCC 20868]|uniref:Uncharacterized protein n=1 Tax=Glarea lozoyensis (strain ATCC 20868 / MF5171) TaxID=1116229 RepID=S3D8K6_GLAL2|nr:uncharacterized protein GLAREA_10482 [Glarea lozoyensis ATCC 20868]EPE34787.1 hypothetical protein GLAREA_10482 [Glarea lozoyensis ATCC 20868]